MATNDYISLKLLIVNGFVPAVLLWVKARESLLHSIQSRAMSSVRECELVGGPAAL